MAANIPVDTVELFACNISVLCLILGLNRIKVENGPAGKG